MLGKTILINLMNSDPVYRIIKKYYMRPHSPVGNRKTFRRIIFSFYLFCLYFLNVSVYILSLVLPCETYIKYFLMTTIYN